MTVSDIQQPSQVNDLIRELYLEHFAPPKGLALVHPAGGAEDPTSVSSLPLVFEPDASLAFVTVSSGVRWFSVVLELDNPVEMAYFIRGEGQEFYSAHT